MKRTKNEQIEKPTWKKVGGGSLRIGNRIIKPGQIFDAFPEEISLVFRKFVIPVSGDANFKTVEVKDATIIQGIKSKFTAQPHGKSLFLFDVVDGNGKILNEKSLKKDVAEKLVEDLLK